MARRVADAPGFPRAVFASDRSPRSSPHRRPIVWPTAVARVNAVGTRNPGMSLPRALLALKLKEVNLMAKPSKKSLSKAGKVLGSDSSTKADKTKAGSTLGKG